MSTEPTNAELLAAIIAAAYEQGKESHREVSDRGRGPRVHAPTQREIEDILDERPSYFHRMVEFAEELIPRLVEAHPQDTVESFSGFMRALGRDVEKVEKFLGPRPARRGGAR